MLAKSVYKPLLVMGLFGSWMMAAALPAQAEILIQSGSLNGNLNYDYDNPMMPSYTLESVDVQSFTLETDIGTISNFEGAAQLTEVSNLAGVGANGKATIGTSGQLSGLITGRSQTADGQFLVFNNTPITIVGRVTSGRDVNEFTQTGTITITGGRIQADAPTTTSQPSTPNFGSAATPTTPQTTPQNTQSVTLSPPGTAVDNFGYSQLAFNAQVTQALSNNPKYVQVGSAGLARIYGPASRIHPGLTAPTRR